MGDRPPRYDLAALAGTPLQADSHFQSAGVDKLQLSESVAMHLREQIISGKLAKGDFLRIDAIAKDLNISTTPVREGLFLLQSESFVQLIPRRGFVVKGFDRSDLMDLFWAQATAGAELAARAATRMSASDLELLQQVHAEHERATAANNVAQAARLGHRFHRTINLAAQSPRLALLMGHLAKQLPNRFYTSIEGQLQDAIEYHPIIMNAILMKDSDAVRSLMFRHIISGGEHLIAMLDRQGVWGQSAPAATAVETPARAVAAVPAPAKTPAQARAPAKARAATKAAAASKVRDSRVRG